MGNNTSNSKSNNINDSKIKKKSKASKPSTSAVTYLSPTYSISRISSELLKRNFSHIEGYSLKQTFDNLRTVNERGIAHINKGAFIVIFYIKYFLVLFETCKKIIP